MREMENAILKDFLAAHSIEWFREKIAAFGRAGTLNESEFYQILDYPAPAAPGFLGDSSTIQSTMRDVIQEPSHEFKIAHNYQQGVTQTTAEENMAAQMQLFNELTQKYLFSGGRTCSDQLHSSDSAE